jgi:transcriptional accessory protein Tex/SPT6
MSADTTQPAPSSLEELVPGMELRGKIKRVELFGAFVDVGVGQDALLHISQLGQQNVRNVEDVVKEGDEVTVYVLRVEPAERRVAVSLLKPPAVSWDTLNENDIVTGTIVRVEGFGVFVDIGAERPGMVHVSELASGFVKSPSDVVKMGDKVQARIIKINRKKRQIDLSMKSLEVEEAVMPEEETEAVPTAMELALRRAMANADTVEDTRRAKAKQAKYNKRSSEQDEILARTLREHSSGS